MGLTFDLYLLGLRDDSADGRQRVLDAAVGFGGCEPAGAVPDGDAPLFSDLSQGRAREIVDALEGVGARIEIRPVVGRDVGAEPSGDDRNASAATDLDSIPVLELAEPTEPCPACGYENPSGSVDCVACGVVFAKLEREKVARMLAEKKLSDALLKQNQIREEWTDKAQQYVMRNPLTPEATSPFDDDLKPADVPFLRLHAVEGPILLTSVRLLAKRDGRLLSIPYELISDVDYGGGFTFTGRRKKLKMKLFCDLPGGRSQRGALAWTLVEPPKDAGGILVDWTFGRKLRCGSCGQPELELRFQSPSVHARCTHCAVDHVVDLDNAVAMPREGG